MTDFFSMPEYFFQPEDWFGRADSLKDQYSSAQPFPHVLLDQFLPDVIADRLLEEFPKPQTQGFQQVDNDHQRLKQGRLQENYFKGVSPFIRHVLNEFNGQVFLDFLEKLTGIQGLIPDPHFHGAAVHQILPGGFLDVHADFNWDHRRKLNRRVNVLLYLNKDWHEEWGGHLELWDPEMKTCHVRALPVFNRCVIFNTNSTSFHGHPDPLQCPEGQSRKSLALYYYTVGRDDEPETQANVRSTWKKRPGDEGPG